MKFGTGIASVIPKDKLVDLKGLSSQIFEGLDLSRDTAKDYQYRIGKFADFVKQKSFEPNTLVNYKKALRDLPGSVSTKNKYFIAAKILLREMYRLGYLPVDITVNVKGFKQFQGHRKDGLNERDILSLQEHCKTLSNTPENLRVKAIIALLLYQGLRQIEICRLNVIDINFQNKLAFITGKGKDDKEIIWLHPYTITALKNYLNAEGIQSGALFQSHSNYCNGSRLTTKSIRGIVMSLLNVLGVSGTVHGFRHFFTTTLIKSYKGELLTVSKYTRHRSIQMLEIYNDEVIRQEDLPRFYDVFNQITI